MKNEKNKYFLKRKLFWNNNFCCW